MVNWRPACACQRTGTWPGASALPWARSAGPVARRRGRFAGPGDAGRRKRWPDSGSSTPDGAEELSRPGFERCFRYRTICRAPPAVRGRSLAPGSGLGAPGAPAANMGRPTLRSPGAGWLARAPPALLGSVGRHPGLGFWRRPALTPRRGAALPRGRAVVGAAGVPPRGPFGPSPAPGSGLGGGAIQTRL